MKLGFVGYTVRFHTFTPEQVEETYRKISALGYDGLENPLGSKFFTPAEELDLLKKYNLSIAVPAGGDLNDPDKCMRLCEEYDVNILGISSIPGEMMNSVDGFKAYALQMNKWAAPFKGTGIRLKYHNHSQEFRNFPELCPVFFGFAAVSVLRSSPAQISAIRCLLSYITAWVLSHCISSYCGGWVLVLDRYANQNSPTARPHIFTNCIPGGFRFFRLPPITSKA